MKYEHLISILDAKVKINLTSIRIYYNKQIKIYFICHAYHIRYSFKSKVIFIMNIL